MRRRATLAEQRLMTSHAALERVRLEGALLMARTAAHRINNALALVVGYTELLAQDLTVRADPRLAECARHALEGSLQAAEELGRLQRIVRLEEDTDVALSLPVLDLERSTAVDPPHEPGEGATTATLVPAQPASQSASNKRGGGPDGGA